MKQHKAKIIDRKIVPYKPKLWSDDLKSFEGKDLLITIEKFRKKRTNRQNRALHLFFTQLADELNLAGYDMKKVIRPDIDISWSALMIKEILWKPLQEVHLGKKSTTKLTTDEIGIVYDQLNRIIAERTKIHVPFPDINLIIDRG